MCIRDSKYTSQTLRASGGGGVQSRKRTAIRAGLLWAMGGGLLVVACAAGLALHGDGLSQVMDCWVALLAVWVPTAVSWLAVYRVRLRRRRSCSPRLR